MKRQKGGKHRRRKATIGVRADGTPYDVGYGRPPKKTQFQTGRSGNPTGLSKSVDIFDESITITEGGKSKVMLKPDALEKSLYVQAIKGDLKAVPQLLALRRYRGKPGYSTDDDLDDGFDYEGVIAEYLERMKREEAACQVAKEDDTDDEDSNDDK